ncbi:MAG: transporter substrate-binding protein [Noviherbaspirillum sp.]|jgi:tripartite-type tricarboxylate transporter receptor subunit TctC|nr:transporter substrate-binding protein [Noviherbaspirillum sp.]
MNKKSTWSRRIKLAALWLCTAGALLPQIAAAQAYPAKPVRIIVPAAPGGGLDSTARILANYLSEVWNQKVLVDNRPGANSIVGAEMVAKSVPDGYTLLIAPSGALTINPLVYPNLPYNPQRDLIPVSLVTTTSFMLLVNSEVPAANVPELLAHLRANPGKLNHASNSASTIISSELLKSLAKVDFVDINYKGGGPATTSTMAGETQFCLVDTGSAAGPIKSGKVRALALTAPQRSRLYPDIPTLAEAGVPGYERSSWMAVLAPHGTPPDIVGKVNAALKQVLAQPKAVANLEGLGLDVVASSPEDATRILREDAEQVARVVKERKIRFQ